MKTFLKVLLVVAAVLLIAHFWPIALLPIALAALAVLVFGSVLAGVVVLGVGLIAAIAVPILAVVIAIATALAPIWVPLLLILGIISLCRRSGRATA